MEKQRTKTYDYGNLFSITVCQECFGYKMNHKSKMVFHGIDADYLDKHKNPILTPKGDPYATFYYHYFEKRFLHLGPLFITGPLQQDDRRIWFGFNLENIERKYPDIKYVDYFHWEDLSNHANHLTPEEEKERRENLFVRNYQVNPPILINLLKELDCSLANAIIARTSKSAQKACKFAGKNLETVIFDLKTAEKIWRDYLRHLSYPTIECNCGIEISKTR